MQYYLKEVSGRLLLLLLLREAGDDPRGPQRLQSKQLAITGTTRCSSILVLLQEEVGDATDAGMEGCCDGVGR